LRNLITWSIYWVSRELLFASYVTRPSIT
jgi:hypothetical protein